MRVGVVGANGFIGRSLCEKLVFNGMDVTAFYNNSFSLIPEKCTKASVSELYNNLTFDVLIISIGNHSSKYDEYVSQLFTLNSIVSKSICKKIIFISSISVYGENEHIISANSCFNNPSTYGLSKICQEFLVKSFNDYTIIRPTYIYGDGMNKDSLLPIWIESAMKKKEIDVYGDGERRQDYLHIDDLTDLCMLSILKPINNNIVVAATGSSISNIEIANFIASCFGNVKINFVNGNNKTSSFLDIAQTKKSYDWSPKMKLFDWLKNNCPNENINL